MSNQTRSYKLKQRAQGQAATRARIVAATVELHREVGPSRTTVAEIARRAGVSRLTVYNHFPQDRQLYAACQQQARAANPMPDFAPALADPRPGAGVQASLHELYAHYRSREAMLRHILRDRSAIPALDELLRTTLDAQLGDLSDHLTARFRVRGRRTRQLRAAVSVAIEFQTWRRLAEAGLDDREAAGLMAAFVAAAAARAPSAHVGSPA